MRPLKELHEMLGWCRHHHAAALERAHNAPKAKPEPSDAWARHSREAAHYAGEIQRLEAEIALAEYERDGGQTLEELKKEIGAA